MKSLVCLLGMIFISVSVVAMDTKITIAGKNITIKEVFEQIEAQSKFTIAYNQTKFNAEQIVDRQIKSGTVENILNRVLKNSGAIYTVKGSHIIIKAKESPKRSSAKPTQTIRGVVADEASGQPMPYATVILLNTEPTIGVTTDSLGRFKFESIPIGRYDIEVSSLGYESNITKEVLLISAKESFREIRLKEQMLQLDEVVVRPSISKEKPLNNMALAGGRMLSVEEANRFAGGFDDPARLASSFAGVAGNLATNSLSIHGNSPQFIQWKLEGVEIPNPTHFADMTGIGGGLFSGLSSQVLGNSDFYNSAYPAEYSNSLSGVFDMSLRNGNNQKHEHTLRVSLLGVDLASEGPISKKHGSSYIINYRNSNTTFVTNDEMGLKYQDLSFKFNFPTRRAGIFSIWGLGLIDKNNVGATEDITEWESFSDREAVKTDLMRAATGLGHKMFVGRDAYIKSSLAATVVENKQDVRMTEDLETFHQVVDIYNKDWSVVFNSYLNKKFSARHTNRTGISVTGLFYDLDFKLSPTSVPITPMEQIVTGGNHSSMISIFSNSLIDITDRLSTNIGLTASLFTLNNKWSVEPRVSFKYKVAPHHTLAVAYGLHSRREKLDYYYVKTPKTGDKLVNKDLDLAKSHHFTLSYSWGITDNIHLRVEPYFQYLYDVPVELGTPFSIINHDTYYLDKALVNEGVGRNYGVDITLERYMNKGYYWLLTGSIFDSKYKGGDGVWRNTRWNRNYIANALIGKEWACGKQKKNVFSANIRFSYQGGDYYTPIDIKASEEQHDIVLDEANMLSQQFSPILSSDITIGYKINRKKASHEFSLQALNIGFKTGQHGYYYNEKTLAIEKIDLMGFLPNISYKIQF